MDKPAKKTIFITGAAGFIGSNLLKILFSKYPDYHFIVLDALTYAGTLDNIPEEIRKSQRFEFWHGNVCDSALVNKLARRSDAIVHLAAETHVSRSIYDDSRFFETDVIGTQVISNAVVANKNIERFIHISSSEVYGTALQEPMTEEHLLEPHSPYAAAKAGADRLVRSYISTYKIPAIILRPFNNYGNNQHLEKAIPRFIASAIKKEPLTVHGTGENSRDWVFVEDCCSAIDRALHADLEKVKFQVINIASGRKTRIIDIAKMVLQQFSHSEKLIKHICDRPGQVFAHLGSTEKAKKLLGWQAQTSFGQGLQKTIDWYKSNPDWWKKQEDSKLVPIKTEDGEIEWH